MRHDAAKTLQFSGVSMANPRFFMHGGVVYPFGRGQPGRFKIDRECTADGTPIHNEKVFIGEIKAQQRLYATLEKAREAKESPSATAASVKRYYLKDGNIVECGPGPLSFEKWASQVIGSDNATLVRPDATVEQFADWKEAQGYKASGAVKGAAQSKIAALEAQAAQTNAMLATLLAKLDAQPATVATVATVDASAEDAKPAKPAKPKA